MITLISGDNIDQVTNFLKKKKIDARKNSFSIFEFTCPINDKAELIDILYSQDIFGSQSKLIILHANNIANIILSDDILEFLSKDKATELILNINSSENSYNKFQFRNLKKYKNLMKISTVRTFDLPKNYVHFNISDAIFIDRDKQKALTLLDSIEDIDKEIFAIISTLHNTIRGYISMKYNNKTYNALHPFVKKKLKNIKMTKKEVDNIYESLYKLDKGIKYNKQDTRSQIQDFVINLY